MIQFRDLSDSPSFLDWLEASIIGAAVFSAIVLVLTFFQVPFTLLVGASIIATMIGQSWILVNWFSETLLWSLVWWLTGVAGWALGSWFRGGWSPLGAGGLVLSLDPGFVSSMGVIAGTITGIFQWLYLRRRLAGTHWWIPANLIATVLASLAGTVVANWAIFFTTVQSLTGSFFGGWSLFVFFLSEPIGFSLGAFVAGVMNASLTGFTLFLFLRCSSPRA